MRCESDLSSKQLFQPLTSIVFLLNFIHNMVVSGYQPVVFIQQYLLFVLSRRKKLIHEFLHLMITKRSFLGELSH